MAGARLRLETGLPAQKTPSNVCRRGDARKKGDDHMKLVLAVAAIAAAFLAMAPAAEARGVGRFGEEDNFNKVQTLSLPAELANALPPEWAKGIELDTHTITHWFGAGAWLEDKGFAITVPGTDDYWQLTDEMTTELQGAGILPSPMPKYEIPIMDYVFGYSLWIVLAVVALFYGGKALLFKKKPEPVPAASPDQPPPAAT